MKTTFDAIVVGSGPAGYTAALYLARAEIDTLVLEGPTPGGCLSTTTEVENYPGFADGVQGPDLVDAMRRQTSRFGAELRTDVADRLRVVDDGFVIDTPNGALAAAAVVLATGSTPRRLGLPREAELTGRGVSTCATCDGFFFRGADVVVVGGGDSAMEEALQLSRLARHVTLVHRSDDFRASAIMVRRVRENPTITVVTGAVVTELIGDEALDGVVVRDAASGDVRTIAASGLFVAIGHDPQSRLVTEACLADVDEAGYVQVLGRSSHTTTPGLFACGDVIDPTYRQAVSAAGSGCVAALDAQRHLHELSEITTQGVPHVVV